MTNLSGTNLNNGSAVGPQGEGRDSPSTFPTYPAYKDSGVEWMGEVPAHWNVAPVGMYYEIRNGFPFSADNFSPEGAPEHRLIRIRDILGNDSPLYTDESCPVQCIVENGDILIGMDGDFNIASWAEGKAKLNQRVCAIRGSSFSWDRFFFYGIGAPLKIINDLTFATTVKHLASSQVLKTRFPIPPETEVDNIARFLDHETARIDALIEEQQRLIELLKEKRQAVISHAVTKGLDPTVPMKDSGVEWLGEVPAHWEVKRLRYLLKANGLIRGPFGGDLKKEIFVERGVKVYEQKNAIYRDFSLGNSFITQDKFSEMRRFEVKAGDYIMSCSGTIGRAYRIPEEAPVGIINQALLVIRFSEELGFEFADWIFVADFFANQIIDNSQGGAMKNLVGMDVFTSISMPVPSVQEQLSIAKYLRDEVSRIDALISAAGQAVNLMQERRSALISAAVTGKIDVRGWQPPASNQAPESAVAEVN